LNLKSESENQKVTMDRATMQNLLMFGGGGYGNQQQGGQGNQQQGGQGQGGQGQGGDPGAFQDPQAAQQAAFAGYPALMRQYLQQQQQQVAMDPRMMAGLMGGGMPGAGQGGAPNAAQGGGGNPGLGGGGFPGGNPAAGFMPQGLAGAGGPDYMDANRMLLQRLQGQNQPDQLDSAANGGDPYAESGILGPWSATSAGLLGKMAVNNQDKGKKVRRKPKDKPKRPLSAYNIFFKEERARILEKIPESDDPKGGSSDAKTRKRKKRPHGKIGFENLAKVIGQRWQELTPEQVEYYKKQAEEDMKRYKDQMEEYLAKQDDSKKKKGDDEDGDDDEAEAPAKKVKSEK
jgi:hypothetical protein